MKTQNHIVTTLIIGALAGLSFISCSGKKEADQQTTAAATYKLIPAKRVLFNSFVDCNMAEAWVGDTFRIFPGKYGEDPLWGNARDLKYADGRNAEEAFARQGKDFTEPKMPANVPIGQPGLHGAVWFETVYQDTTDRSGKTLYAVYHNENYPATLPYDPKTGEGYIDKKWPQGLTGLKSPAAVCRIGIMKSTNGGKAWENKGLFIEDLQPRMILKPHNTSKTFAGGVGDPSAVASGDYLYMFYGEYGYPGQYDEAGYDRKKEWSGQCISVARIKLSDLDNPVGKARRWDGKGFNAPYNGVGAPIASLQIPESEGGGAASSPTGGFHWGPSVSWNTYLNCWVMLMGKVVGQSWAGSSIHISFNQNRDLGEALQSQAWSKPKLLLDKPGFFLWYPSLQPMNTPDDIANKHTCLRLGQRARLFVKNIKPEKSEYLSEYILEFSKGTN
ncbi:hypothetical protein [Spirosoma sp.]|uniref:hypothetical protein n=1 Tax=Spirosoma sp. TaxID=1899569 RepID=UPI00262F80AF|nr:hypothetical protein [Spirosoma sp.]MCX6213200.1 hypothetical protein [Spirosoma sp.]